MDQSRTKFTSIQLEELKRNRHTMIGKMLIMPISQLGFSGRAQITSLLGKRSSNRSLTKKMGIAYL